MGLKTGSKLSMIVISFWKWRKVMESDLPSRQEGGRERGIGRKREEKRKRGKEIGRKEEKTG